MVLSSGQGQGPLVGSRPTLTSGHHEADVLHSEHRQLFLRVHPDDPVGQPVHGEDTPAGGLVAVVCGPVGVVPCECAGAGTCCNHRCHPSACAYRGQPPQGAQSTLGGHVPRCLVHQGHCVLCLEKSVSTSSALGFQMFQSPPGALRALPPPHTGPPRTTTTAPLQSCFPALKWLKGEGCAENTDSRKQKRWLLLIQRQVYTWVDLP